MTLQDRVAEALANAVENGYEAELRAMDAEQLAIDMAFYCADLESVSLVVLIPLCQAWLDKGVEPHN